MPLIVHTNDSSNSLYHSTCIRRKWCIPFSDVPNFNHIEEFLLNSVSNEIEGMCITEGFVQPGSCRLRSYSIGIFAAGNIRFNLEIECMICSPKEGDIISCIAKTATHAGIRAHACTNPSPVVIYISREMHDANANARLISNHMSIDTIKPGDVMQVRVVGRRFELNDKHVSVIGELTMPTV